MDDFRIVNGKSSNKSELRSCSMEDVSFIMRVGLAIICGTIGGLLGSLFVYMIM